MRLWWQILRSDLQVNRYIFPHLQSAMSLNFDLPSISKDQKTRNKSEPIYFFVST